jgi:N-acetylmuramoyl-L-alanine amidase
MGFSRFFPAVGRPYSAILFAVQKLLSAGLILLAAGAPVAIRRGELDSNPRQPAQPEQSSPQAGASQGPGNQQPPPAQIVPPATTHPAPVVILNPAHGGADTGARGTNGTLEKDVVLLFARIVRIELERQGYRVAMTRNDDSNPSYDDRAAIANSHRDALFISFHLASTGTFGSMRVYYYQFPNPPPTAAGANPEAQSAPSSAGLVLWEEAQRPYAEASRHLADILEGDLAQHFGGSPTASTGVAVREMRSVAAPAVAVEISSVAVNDPHYLISLAQPLATSILRSIQAYRPATATGAN